LNKLTDSDSEATETQVWLDFARDGGYLDEGRHKNLMAGSAEIGRMIGSMMAKREKFTL
jgi:four helix bundle protein